jgi:predicted HicB family RNase H-like nuclease
MAITKRPKSNQSPPPSKSDDRKAEAFISGAGGQATREEKPAKKVPVMMRFDPEVLRRVDRAAKHRGVSRSAWIQYTLSRALDQGEG